MDLLEEKRWELVNLSKGLKIKDDRIIIPLQFFRMEELQELINAMKANPQMDLIEWDDRMCHLLLKAIEAKEASESK